MGDSERSVKPVILDDGAASLWRADGAHVCHAKGVAGVVSTEILEKEDTRKLIKTLLFVPTITWK